MYRCLDCRKILNEEQLKKHMKIHRNYGQPVVVSFIDWFQNPVWRIKKLLKMW